MTKPRLVKVRALFYVLQQIQKEAAPILTQPLQSGLAEREGVFLGYASKALRDNDPRGSHPSLSDAKKSNPAGCFFWRRERLSNLCFQEIS